MNSPVNLLYYPWQVSGEGRPDDKGDKDGSKEKEVKRDIVPYYLREKRRVVGRASTESNLVVATGRPVGRDQLVAAIGTLGDSPFKIYGRYGERRQLDRGSWLYKGEGVD